MPARDPGRAQRALRPGLPQRRGRARVAQAQPVPSLQHLRHGDAGRPGFRPDRAQPCDAGGWTGLGRWTGASAVYDAERTAELFCTVLNRWRTRATMIHDSILDTIGRTPIVRINRLAPPGIEMYAKLEAFNPMSSVKDRLALGIILDAEARGELKPGQMVVEATSGNTGIALAMVCAARGYPFVAFMSDTFSIERRKLMRALGAKVILTPAAERGTGMVKRAAEFAEKHGAFLTRQFENEANPAYHRNTTGPEILQDFAGRAAGLVRHRLRHRRHADRRGRDAQAGAPGHQDRGHRTGGRGPALGQASGSRTRSRAGRRISSRRCSTATIYDRDPAGRRRARARHRARPGDEGRHLLRHFRRRHLRRGAGSGARPWSPAAWCWR